ncbi:nucleoside-diphosphate sugar epimerase [Paenibacillus sp. JSM ZJ436]|uniref:nucleoside-diphosphate sugar epimerase n=1 Tax=Paenibacillus sp. JSM ZJ436 TaxID=3376190 RepID=UPI0037A03B5B
MEQKIDELMNHLSHSQQQMARILEAQRHAAVRMAQVVHGMPDDWSARSGVAGNEGKPGGRESDDAAEGFIQQIQQVNGSIAAYLNVMADFQQAAADHLEMVMKELRGGDSEE